MSVEKFWSYVRKTFPPLSRREYLLASRATLGFSLCMVLGGLLAIRMESVVGTVFAFTMAGIWIGLAMHSIINCSHQPR
jgi:hypothetical protein